jgi:hypothetical protein
MQSDSGGRLCREVYNLSDAIDVSTQRGCLANLAHSRPGAESRAYTGRGEPVLPDGATLTMKPLQAAERSPPLRLRDKIGLPVVTHPPE